MVTIKEVKTRKDLRTFASFNEKMYRDVPQAMPDLISDEMANFNPKKNPAYEYAESRQFLAYKDGKCVGRIAGIISHKANEKWKRKRIRFTRVDFIDDYEVSEALFKAVEDWGREAGLDAIHGPIGFCDLDQEGMLIEGFEYDGIFITINNAPYYKDHMRRLGYTKCVDWIENRINIPDKVSPFFEKVSDRVLKENNLKVIKLKYKFQLRKYIRYIFDVINDAAKELYGEVDLTDDMIKKYVNQFILMVNVRFISLIVNEKDEMVGIGVTVPTIGRAAKKSHGKLFPFGWARILYAPYSKPDTLELYLVGVREKYRNKGLPMVLMTEVMKEAVKDGMKYAETGPMLEDNIKVQSMWKRFDKIQHRRRRCWIKKLD